MTALEFTCAQCGETFTKQWSDEEALEEAEGLFGAVLADEGAVVVCDDCWQTITASYSPETYVANVTNADPFMLLAHEVAVDVVRRYVSDPDVYDFAVAHRVVEAVLALREDA